MTKAIMKWVLTVFFTTTLIACVSAPKITSEDLNDAEMDLGLSAEELADFEEMDVSTLISEEDLLDVYAIEDSAPIELLSSDQPIDFEALEKAKPAAARDLENDVFVVYFGFNSSDLNDENKRALEEQVDMLRVNQPSTTLNGHTDERGSNEFNLTLSERRAIAVRDFLVSKGLSKSLFTVVAYGEEAPFSVGSDERSWRLNRRVEMVRSQ